MLRCRQHIIIAAAAATADEACETDEAYKNYNAYLLNWTYYGLYRCQIFF